MREDISTTLLTSSLFNWNNDCFICGKEANGKKENKVNKSRRRKIVYINHSYLNDTLVNFIRVQKDDYYRQIHKRISGIEDLKIIGAKYHEPCYDSLRNSAASHSVEKKSHEVSLIDMAMEAIYQYIEQSDDCQFSLDELRNVISTEYLPDNKTIKARLISHYGDNIILSSKFAYSTLICFKNKHILSQQLLSEKCNTIEEKEIRILQAAGKIIRREIRSEIYCNDYYAASDKMFADINECIPKSLSFLLSEIILTVKKRKQKIYLL